MNPLKEKYLILKISMLIGLLTAFHHLSATTHATHQVIITDATNAIIDGKTFASIEHDVLKKHKIYVFRNLSNLKTHKNINENDIKQMLGIHLDKAKTLILSPYKNKLLYTSLQEDYNLSQIDATIAELEHERIETSDNSESSHHNPPNRHKTALTVARENTVQDEKIPFREFYLSVKHKFGNIEDCGFPESIHGFSREIRNFCADEAKIALKYKVTLLRS